MDACLDAEHRLEVQPQPRAAANSGKDPFALWQQPDDSHELGGGDTRDDGHR